MAKDNKKYEEEWVNIGSRIHGREFTEFTDIQRSYYKDAYEYQVFYMTSVFGEK